MTILPTEEREGEETLTKELVHEHNRQEEQKMKDHENQNPNLGKGHNPIHHGPGCR
jgi:hypothetical protein